MQSVIKSYTGIVATGALDKVAIPDSARSFAVEVSIPSGAITSWTVNLEGSLDGVNWTQLISHTTPIGSTQWAVDKPVTFVRINVATLVLNTAPSITVALLAVP